MEMVSSMFWMLFPWLILFYQVIAQHQQIWMLIIAAMFWMWWYWQTWFCSNFFNIHNEIKNSTPVQLFFSAIFMWIISFYGDNFGLNFKYNNKFALFFLTAGVVIIGLSIVTFIMAETMITPLHPDKSSNLVKTGIYQYTRNPMYLGLLLILFSIEW